MEVRHDEEGSRFTARTDAGEASLSYTELEGGRLDLRHTEVPPGAEGEGVGGALVKAAFEHARSSGVGIVPSCPFVRSYLERHPEYAELAGD